MDMDIQANTYADGKKRKHSHSSLLRYLKASF